MVERLLAKEKVAGSNPVFRSLGRTLVGPFCSLVLVPSHVECPMSLTLDGFLAP